MKNHAANWGRRFALPIILAGLASFWAVDSAAAEQVALNVVADKSFEVTGGSGKQAWRIQYGTGYFKPRFVTTQGNRAWLAHGGWLRLLDTEKGLVIGRWHFGSEITDLVPHGTTVEIEVEEHSGEQPIRRSITIDPASPHVPYWPTDFLMLGRVSPDEVRALWPSVFRGGNPGGQKAPQEEAKKLLPELEEQVRRDPLSPWFQVALGKALKDTGDPRAAQVYQQAVNNPGADFSELFAISSFFDSDGDYDLGRAAFERGYQDFWQRGNDPRLFTALIARFMIYQPSGPDWGKPATPRGRELIERMYRLSPYGEAAPWAWKVYADYLAQHGPPDQASLWRNRALDASRNATFSFTGASHARMVDPMLLLLCASAWAAIAYALVMYAKYRPQSKLDVASGKQARGLARVAAFLNAHYWSRAERVALFSILLVGWLAAGFLGQYVNEILRLASAPIGAMSGSLAGPGTIARFENLPATPERDLLVAVAAQQAGQLDPAERTYRNLPQFAEAWNNLGVILKAKGKDAEAKSAFEKALSIDPNLAEAALNLGRPPADFWTEQYQKNVPGRPMLAIPSGPHMAAAFAGGSDFQIFLRALAGPFSSGDVGGVFGTIGKLAG